MEVVEDALPVDLETFLERPLVCHLSTLAEAGPRVSPLWYLHEDDALWIIADTETKTHPERIRRDPRVAAAIVDFDAPTGLVQHVGVRGRATLAPFDVSRANRLLARYLGDDRSTWDPRFTGPWDDRWRFIRLEPATVVARDQSFDAE
ncbi:MAG: pyridoxamine 5'-phosphate oxidase family protein [Halobacteriales archaeon]